ncbi:MAG: polysaccharide deacetylase family protein [Bacillota bacterium]|jgi:peptidoglycan/xylan/chitin deacetylase (PgdA/CDA1 family)
MYKGRDYSFRPKSEKLRIESGLGNYNKKDVFYNVRQTDKNPEENEKLSVFSRSEFGARSFQGQVGRSNEKVSTTLNYRKNGRQSVRRLTDRSKGRSGSWLSGLDRKISANQRKVSSGTGRRKSRTVVVSRRRRIKKLPCLILLFFVLLLIFGGCKIFNLKAADGTAAAGEPNMSVFNQEFWDEKVYVGEDVINGTGETVAVPRAKYEAYVESIGGKENIEKYTYFRQVARGTLDAGYIKRGSVFNVETGNKIIALSFDDGPDADTIDDYLAILKKYDATATFFMLGKNMEKHPEAVQKIIESGNEPATHTWSHKNFNKVSAEVIQADLEKSAAVFQQLVGYKPYLMRCPYGNINDTVKALNSQMGMISAMWNIDTLDWKKNNPDSIVNSVKAYAGGGQIILMHEGKDIDLQALPKILQWLTDEGYKVVSVGEMLWEAHENGEDGVSCGQ